MSTILEKSPVQTELKLSDLRRLIPSESLQPPTAKNLLGFFIKFSSFAFCFYLACSANSFLEISLWTLLTGIAIFSLGTVGHDCGHGFHVRPKWLNELIGQMSMIMHGLPYAGWKHSHNTHHANTNRGDLDPDRLWLYSDEFAAMPPLGKFFWKAFHTRLFWLSAIGHYFISMLPWSFQIEKHTDKPEEIKTCKIDNIIFISTLAILHTSMYFAGFGFKSLLVHFVAILIAFACLSIYVRTEHYLLDNGWEVHDKPWLTSRTVLQNPLLDFIATNLNYHVEHHILQTIPHANLPSLRPMLKDVILKAGQPYHEADFGQFLKLAFNQEFFVLERETFIEIPNSRLQASK